MFCLDPAPNYPRYFVRVLTTHRAVLITRIYYLATRVACNTCTRPPTEEEGSIAHDESTSDRGGGGVVDELDDDLVHLNDLDLTCGFDLDACLQVCRQQSPAAGDVGDGKAETTSLFRGGAVGASSAPAGRAESETIGSSQGGEVDASAPRKRTNGSSQLSAVDASSVPTGRAERHLSARSTSGADQGNGEDPPAALSGRAAHKMSLGAAPRDSANAWRVNNLLNNSKGCMNPRSRTRCLRQRKSGPNPGVS